VKKLTQEDVNETFEKIKAEWDKRREESGLSDAMFLALDNTGFASEFIGLYQQAKEHVESNGLFMPELIAGLEVTYT
jgi:hypothetical protein